MTVEIEVWVADLTFPGYMDRLRRIADRFHDSHPGYRVNITGHDFRELPRIIAQAAAVDRHPAVAEYYFYMTPVARDMRTPDGRPLFTSVQRELAGRRQILDEPVLVDDLIPAVREFYTLDGDLVSMPTVATTMLLYANMSILRRAGIDELPGTWQAVETVCEAVAALPDPPAHAITWANHGLLFQQAMAVQGSPLANHDNGRSAEATAVNLGSPEMLAWVDWWRQLHQRGHYLYTGKIPDWEGTFRAFATGAVALRLTSSNDHDYMTAAARKAGFELGTGRFPYRDGTPYGGNIVAGTSLWLASGLDPAVRDGALAFMQFINNPRNAADRHMYNSFLPVTHESFALLEREDWFTENPYHRAGSDQLASYPDRDTAGPPPVRGALFGDFAGVQDVMTRAMDDVLRHGVDPATRFAAAEDEAAELLATYRAGRGPAGPRHPHSFRVEHFTGAEAYSGADLERVTELHS